MGCSGSKEDKPKAATAAPKQENAAPTSAAADNGNNDKSAPAPPAGAAPAEKEAPELTAAEKDALFEAIEKGDVDAVQKVVEDGKAGGNVAKDGQPALHAAAAHGQEAVLKLLLDNGAKADAVDGAKQTALHVAAAAGHEESCMLLVARGADISAVNEETMDAPLHTAAAAGQTGVVKVLLKEGAAVNSKGANGRTALHHAGFQGLYEMALCLLEGGADKSITDDAALLKAEDCAYANNYEQTALLIEKWGEREPEDVVV